MRNERVYAAIIGGGASGMMCTIHVAQKHPDQRIIILEKADRVGKKLLVTGNGRCNLTNISSSADRYHGEGAEDLINILFEKYDAKAVLREFHSLGLLTHTDSEGRVYPLSNQASSVLDVLRRRLAELSVETLCGVGIHGLQKSAKGYEIYTTDKRILAENIVIATGGRSDYAGRESGSRELLHMLGLGTVKASPSLSPVKVNSELLRSLKGVRALAQVSLIQNGQVVRSERGEVQFTENALSGICVFNLSREANRLGGEIAVNLLPELDEKAVVDEIAARVRRDPNAPAQELLIGMFHKAIGLALLKASRIKPSQVCKDISELEIKRLCRQITDWRFPCEINRDFQKAQVTAGGVRLREIDPKTYESKKHKGLYVIGEALDIDGDCGGYNLQFAFASAMCAGDSL